MCQASVYLDDQKIIDEAIWLEPTENGVLVHTFFEAPQEVKGRLKGVDLIKHRVLIESGQPASK